jgi:PTS system lactose-specific IIC component
LAVIKKDGAFLTDYMGTKGLLSSFISAFVTVNLYKFCVLKDITIKMPKEVPGSISQNFRDVFPFSFAILTNAIIDLLSRYFLNVPFAESFSELLSPLFTAAESYLGISIIWFLIPLFWFVGVHGPSVVKPGLASALFGNTEANLELFKAGQHPFHVLTENFGNFIGELGGTGATFVVPIIFILLMKSKQLKAVGKSSIIPVMFAVNEPLLFAAPIILNPYFFVPFILAPMVNVCIGKFFIDVFHMNGFMYILPWATPGPIGTAIATGFQPISILLSAVLIAVDILIYLPFCKAYDKVLVEQEKLGAEVADVQEEIASTDEKKAREIEQVTKTLENEINVLVLCAGAGTSAMLANALTEGAKDFGVPISASAGAYGSHYEIMKDYDFIILAPQVAVNFESAKEDAKKYGIKVVATKGADYIKLTRDPKKAIDFVLDSMNKNME